jgi:hypothetical protein
MTNLVDLLLLSTIIQTASQGQQTQFSAKNLRRGIQIISKLEKIALLDDYEPPSHFLSSLKSLGLF